MTVLFQPVNVENQKEIRWLHPLSGKLCGKKHKEGKKRVLLWEKGPFFHIER